MAFDGKILWYFALVMRAKADVSLQPMVWENASKFSPEPLAISIFRLGKLASANIVDSLLLTAKPLLEQFEVPEVIPNNWVILVALEVTARVWETIVFFCIIKLPRPHPASPTANAEFENPNSIPKTTKLRMNYPHRVQFYADGYIVPTGF